MFDERPAAYFSHSYDVLDRRVTDFFLEALSQRFALAVDPRSATLSTMHLELMMRRTACFVAVVTRRENQPRYRCSPFAVHEYGMAVLANRPRLVIPEINIPARHFIGADVARPFNRNRLAAYRMPLDALDELAARAREHADDVDRPLGSAALMLPPTSEYTAAVPELHRLLSYAGWQVEDVSGALLRDEVDAAGAATLLDRFDFVVIDVLDPRTPGWVLPFLQARGVPTVRCVGPDPGHLGDASRRQRTGPAHRRRRGPRAHRPDRPAPPPPDRGRRGGRPDHPGRGRGGARDRPGGVHGGGPRPR